MSRRQRDQQDSSRRQEPASARGEQPVRLEEASLIEEIKSGQTDRFEELVRRYQDRVFNACWRISGHLEDARDLAQEAFLRAFQEIGSFRHESSFYTWVFRIAVNLALSHRRRAGRRAMISLDQEYDAHGSQAQSLAGRVAGRDASPDERARQAEDHQRVARALQSIDLDFRIVIVLRDIEGFGYQEISRILDIQPGTVKSRLFRARSALKQAITEMTSPRSSEAGKNHE